jgi:hypothetical protein
MGFFSDPQNALYNSWNSQLDLQHLLPPPPHSFHSSSDMRVNFPSSSDSMQIWKLVSPLHDLLGSLVSITFWAVLIDIGLWRILTLCLFVCHYLLLEDEEGYVVLKLIAHLFCRRTSKSFPQKTNIQSMAKKKLHSLNKCWKCHEHYLSQQTHTHTHTHNTKHTQKILFSKHRSVNQCSTGIIFWTYESGPGIGYLKTTLITNLVFDIGSFFNKLSYQHDPDIGSKTELWGRYKPGIELGIRHIYIYIYRVLPQVSTRHVFV